MALNYSNSNPFTGSTMQMSGSGYGPDFPQMGGSGGGNIFQPISNPGIQFAGAGHPSDWQGNSNSPWAFSGADYASTRMLFGNDMSDWRSQQGQGRYDNWMDKKNTPAPAPALPQYNAATMGPLASSFSGLFLPQQNGSSNPFFYF